MAKWNEYGLKSGTSAEDEVLILDSDTNTNKRTTVGDIQEFANGKMLEKENSTLNTEAKDLIGAINEVDAKNTAQDTKIEEVENKFSDYLKKTDVDGTLSVSGSPADAKVVGEQFKKSEEAITDLVDKKITKFYASNQGNTHLPDSDKGKIQDMFLYGKSEQVQYKGTNKLTLHDGQQINTGIECKVVDSKLQFKGTATSNYCTFDAKEVTISAGKKITAYTDSTKDWFIWLRDSDNKLYALNKSVKTATYDKDVTLKQFGLQNYQPGDSINMIVDFGLMVGSDTYEPYTGGISSPNPDYPQEIKAAVNPKVVVRGKNLFDFGQFKGTAVVRGSAVYDENGVTITSTDADCFTLYSYTDKVLKIPVKSGKTYTLSWKASENTPGSIVVFYDGLSSSYKVVDNANVKKNVFTVPVNRTFVTIRLGVTQSGKTVRYYDIQLEENDDSTSYEPYTEQSTILPYTLYAIPVTTGGNITIGGKQYVADYVDVERGKLVRMCKEVDFTKVIPVIYSNPLIISREARYSYANKDIGVKPINDKATYGTGAGYITNARFIGMGTWNNDTVGIAAHGQGDGQHMSIRIPLGVDAKEYFTSIGGCKGIFQIATPQEIDLTQDQIQAFKSLSTNYPVTNIEVSSDQLDGYTVFNYPISMAEGWNYVKQQIGDTRDYIYDMDLQSAEAYVNSEYAVALTELEVM